MKLQVRELAGEFERAGEEEDAGGAQDGEEEGGGKALRSASAAASAREKEGRDLSVGLASMIVSVSTAKGAASGRGTVPQWRGARA